MQRLGATSISTEWTDPGTGVLHAYTVYHLPGNKVVRRWTEPDEHGEFKPIIEDETPAPNLSRVRIKSGATEEEWEEKMGKDL